MDFIASFEKSSLPQIRSDLLHVHDRLFNRNDDQSNQLNYTLDDQHNCPISRAISTINEYGSILDTGPEKVIKVTTDYENSKVIIDSKKSSIKRQQHLDAIRFDIFCYVMLKHIRGGKNKFDALKKALVTNNVFSRHNTTDTDLKNEMLAQLRILSYLFEATDIDSRGSISWLDFTNLCLRIGRIQFKPSVKRSITLYHEKIRNSDGQAGKQIPVHTIFYIPETSLLFALDSDTPSTRIFE